MSSRRWYKVQLSTRADSAAIFCRAMFVPFPGLCRHSPGKQRMLGMGRHCLYIPTAHIDHWQGQGGMNCVDALVMPVTCPGEVIPGCSKPSVSLCPSFWPSACFSSSQSQSQGVPHPQGCCFLRGGGLHSGLQAAAVLALAKI